MKRLRQETVSKLRKQIIAPFGIRGDRSSNIKIDKSKNMSIPFYNVNPLYDMSDCEWGSRLVATVTAAASRAFVKSLKDAESVDNYLLDSPALTAVFRNSYNQSSFDDMRSANLYLGGPSQFRAINKQYEFALVDHEPRMTFAEVAFFPINASSLFSISPRESTLLKIKDDVLSDLRKRGLKPEEQNHMEKALTSKLFCFFTLRLKHSFSYFYETPGSYSETTKPMYGTNFSYYYAEAVIKHMREQFIRKLSQFAAGLPELK